MRTVGWNKVVPVHPTFASFFPETALEEFDLALRRDEHFALRVIQRGIETSFVPYGITREMRLIAPKRSARGSASWPAFRECELEGRTFADCSVSPDPATMALDDSADRGEADAGAREFFVGM